MPLVPVQPFVLKNISLVVDVDDFASHVSSAALVPSTKTETLTWHGLTDAPDAAFTEASPAETEWVLNLTAAQDWDNDDSLVEYMFAHAGEKKTVQLVPKAGSGQTSFTVVATMVPPQIGGDYKQVQTSTLSCPVDGTPVKGATV